VICLSARKRISVTVYCLPWHLRDLLGKTFLKKGYSPDPFPKTFNSFWSGGAVLLRTAECRYFAFLHRKLPLAKKELEVLVRGYGG